MSRRTDLLLRLENKKGDADLIPESKGIDWNADNIVLFSSGRLPWSSEDRQGSFLEMRLNGSVKLLWLSSKPWCDAGTSGNSVLACAT